MILFIKLLMNLIELWINIDYELFLLHIFKVFFHDNYHRHSNAIIFQDLSSLLFTIFEAVTGQDKGISRFVEMCFSIFLEIFPI